MPTDHPARTELTVMEREPDLSPFGFGAFDSHRKTPAERDEEVQRNRPRLLDPDHLDGFTRARAWLCTRKRTKHVNRNAGSSYGLKHEAEPRIGYTANGVFIAAAIAEGFLVKRCAWDSPNAWLNITTAPAPLPTIRRWSRRRAAADAAREMESLLT